MNTLSIMPKYESYKESGEQWMAEVPEHWEVKKLKHIFFEKKHTYNPKLNCGSISFGEVVTKDDEKIPVSTKASYQEVMRDEFLINPLNLNYDLISLRIALSKIDVVVSAGYIVLKDKGTIVREYYKYLLHRYDVAYMKLLGSGVRQTINFGHIANSLLVIPPSNEQAAIAKFLDRKTTQIDQVIAIKEKQIDLLKERKEVLIQDAVTLGLDKNLPTKKSGAEWIADVPEHWEVKKLKHLFYEKKYTKNSHLNCGSISFGEVVTKDDEKIPLSTKASYQEVLKGEYLINPLNLNYDLKSLRIALSKIDVVVSSGYIVLKHKESINRGYFKYLLHRYDVAYMKLLGSGVRQTINFGHIANSLLLFPPLPEQTAIANYLDKKTAQVEQTIEHNHQQIERLKEYKTTLVNSAVTGKIKVI